MRSLPTMEIERSQVLRGSTLVLLIGLLAITASCSTSCVRTGHIGVVTLFGRVTGQNLHEGLNFVNPMAVVPNMSIQTQEQKEHADVPSKEGLIVGLEVSLFYHLLPDKASQIFQSVGTNYLEILVVPNLRSVMRAVTSAHEASALYGGAARQQLADEMRRSLEGTLAARGIEVESVLLRDVVLPATLKVAIEAKQQADQEAQRMAFVLLKEKQEAERKRVEAQGVQDFQRIVSEGISDKLLEWKGIEATLRLAESQNAKVVIVGSPKAGLPLIFQGQ